MRIPDNCASCCYYNYAISMWSENHRKKCQHPDASIDYKYHIPFHPNDLPDDCPLLKEQQNEPN